MHRKMIMASVHDNDYANLEQQKGLLVSWVRDEALIDQSIKLLDQIED
jgi:hypothetical protein